MFRFYPLLTCILLLGFAGFSKASPLDSPGTVYIDDLPCNRACQSYMAWSRRLLSQQAPPVTSQSTPQQIGRSSSKIQIQRTSKTQASKPAKAVSARVVKRAVPNNAEKALPNPANGPDTPKEAKSTSNDKKPTPATEAGGKSSSGEDLTTAATNPTPETRSDDNPELSKPSTDIPPVDANANPPAQQTGLISWSQ
jgi:hypothetical protein